MLPVVLVATMAVGIYVVNTAGAAARRCVAAPATVVVHNTFGWGQYGSWAKPGETYPYDVQVYNQDVDCGRSTFTVTPTLPHGFTADVQSLTFTVRTAVSSELKRIYITSPAGSADGDYAIPFSGVRTSDGTATNTVNSAYKVYSSDSQLPVFAGWGPADGATVTGDPYLVVATTDDHAMKRVELYVDGTLVHAEDASPIMQYRQMFGYTWPARQAARGAHKLMGKAYDQYGNVATKTSTFYLK